MWRKLNPKKDDRGLIDCPVDAKSKLTDIEKEKEEENIFA